jgi:hypothetical protein
MLAPDIIEHTDHRQFLQLLELLNTHPVEFIHLQFPHCSEVISDKSKNYQQMRSLLLPVGR